MTTNRFVRFLQDADFNASVSWTLNGAPYAVTGSEFVIVQFGDAVLTETAFSYDGAGLAAVAIDRTALRDLDPGPASYFWSMQTSGLWERVLEGDAVVDAGGYRP